MSKKTLTSRDGKWRVVINAWKHNYLVYKSIGVEATAYQKGLVSIAGRIPLLYMGWVPKAATSISIGAVFSGSGPGQATIRRQWTNKSHGEIKESAVGFSITLPADSIGDLGGSAVLDLTKVTGDAQVVVSGETLSGAVSAS